MFKAVVQTRPASAVMRVCRHFDKLALRGYRQSAALRLAQQQRIWSRSRAGIQVSAVLRRHHLRQRGRVPRLRRLQEQGQMQVQPQEIRRTTIVEAEMILGMLFAFSSFCFPKEMLTI